MGIPSSMSGHLYLTGLLIEHAQGQGTYRLCLGFPDPEVLAQWILNAADQASVALETHMPGTVLLVPTKDAHPSQVTSALELLEDFQGQDRVLLLDVRRGETHPRLTPILRELIQSPGSVAVFVLGPARHLPAPLGEAVTWLSGFRP